MRTLWVSLVLALTLSCAHAGIKAKLSTGHQAVHQALVTLDESERALCQPKPAPNTNQCSSPLAAAAKLTDAKHQDLSRRFVKAFDLDAKASMAIIAWRAGDPVPADLTTLFNDARELVSVTSDLTGGSLAAKAKTFFDKVQELVDTFGGGK